jgi:predicted phage terminase large subunit-like protein
MTDAQLDPDQWQVDLLSQFHHRTLLLCTRQGGKSTAAAALAIQAALLEAPALVLLLSPTQRQSGELFRDKVLPMYRDLGEPVKVVQKSQLELTLANGSRIVALPGGEATIRGYSGVALLVIDEASRIPDDLYKTVRPMLAVSGGRLIALSTPFGQRGWFYEAWKSQEAWQRIEKPAQACPRIDPAFLAEEKASMGPAWYRQEYECSFESMEGAEWPAEWFEDCWFDRYPHSAEIILRVLSLDPSKGKDTRVPADGKDGDYSAFIDLAMAKDGTIYCDADLDNKRDSGRIIAQGIDLCRRTQYDAFAVEINTYQELLAAEFLRQARECSPPLILPMYGLVNTVNKQVRIRRLGPMLAGQDGRIKFRAGSKGTKLLVSQLREFPVGAHDDGPDALEQGMRMLIMLMGGAEALDGKGSAPVPMGGR